MRSKPVLSATQTVVLCEKMVPTNRTAKILSLSVCLAIPGLSWSQQSLIDEIRVTAPALSGPGGFIDPDLTYDPVEIDAFGASTLGELLQELEPGVIGVRGRRAGRPIVLVNGRRIASFLEILSYPPEAVSRIQIFPAEVALRYGYRANQRVVNVELVSEFKATTANTRVGVPTEGDGEELTASVDFLQIEGDRRINVNGGLEELSALRASDRSVPERSTLTPFSLEGNLRSSGDGEIDPGLSSAAGTTVTDTTLPEFVDSGPLTFEALLPFANNPLRTDTREYRTLGPEESTYSIGGSYSHPIGEQSLATVSANFERANGDSELGLAGYTTVIDADNVFSPFSSDVQLNRYTLADGSLSREREADLYEVSGSLATVQNGWTWSWLTNVEHRDRHITTPRRQIVENLPPTVNPFGDLSNYLRLVTDEQRMDAYEYSTSLLASGTVADLPAGPISTAITTNLSRIDQDSTSLNETGRQNSSLQRELGQLGANFDIPLLVHENRDTLSANLNAEISHYSDFDTVNSYGAGINFKPSRLLELRAFYAKEAIVPNIYDLGDPRLLTPNQNVYDFTNERSVSATRVSGGNSELDSEEEQRLTLSARLRPLKGKNLTVSLNWIESKLDDPISGFPTPSAEIEAAFPERFVRDAQGNLLAFDSRPINLQAADVRELRWSVRYAQPIGGAGAKGAASGRENGSRRNRNSSGRFLVVLRHTWLQRDDWQIASGLPALDYVGHDSNSSGGGGSENRVELRATYFRDGLGLRMEANWEDGITSLPNPDGSIDLNQSDLLTVDVSAHYKFRVNGRFGGQLPWLDRVRVRLQVENLFNERYRVRDQFGNITSGRSGDELDPYGRTITLQVRKLFD